MLEEEGPGIGEERVVDGTKDTMVDDKEFRGADVEDAVGVVDLT